MSGPVRFDVGTVPVVGIAAPVYYEFDYTHPDVAQTYYTNIKVIYDIYNRSPNTLPATGDATFITQADADAVAQAFANLQNLAANGLVRNNTTTTTKTFYLTKEMATNLDLLTRSFMAVGAPDPASGLTQAALAKWKDLASVSDTIYQVMSGAINAISMNGSLQSIIELNYVKAGSDFIGDKLSSLEDALTITNSVLTTLSNLQDIRNRMLVKQPAQFDKTLGGLYSTPLASAAASAYLGPFKTAASAYFNQTIYPKVISTIVVEQAGFSTNPRLVTLGAQGQSIFDQLVAIKRSLQSFIPRLSAISSTATLQDTNSLYGRLKSILGDFSTAFVFKTTLASNATAFAGDTATTAAQKAQAINRFLIDNQVGATNNFYYVSSKSPGDVQSDLTFAATAAQGLNDQQKDAVRNFLFVFEEFYKSAAAMLSKISDIIQKFAQNMSR